MVIFFILMLLHRGGRSIITDWLFYRPLVQSSKIKALSASDDKESASTIVGARVAVQWDDGVYKGSVSVFDGRVLRSRSF